MNIFVTSPCPKSSAKFLDDKRVIKMVLESAQMLSTALYSHTNTSPYKPTHINHPCSIWTRQTRKNYMWLLEHFIALCEEYTLRTRKTHKCSQYIPYFRENAIHIPDGELTKFANCAKNKDKGVDFSHLPVHEAYINYLIGRFYTDKRVAKCTLGVCK